MVFTTISIDASTRDRLKEIGKKGQRYDDIIKEILDKERRRK